MYTVRNFKTKKALKDAVAAWNAATHEERGFGLPRAVTYYQPGPFGGDEPWNGKIYVEGPHYPEPHRWYATCDAVDGVIVKVR